MAFASWIPLIVSLIPYLFKGKQDESSQNLAQKQKTTQTIPPSGYQSPLLGLLDPLAVNLLFQNLGRFSGAGMPGGKGLDLSWTNQIMNLLGPEFNKILERYKTYSNRDPYTIIKDCESKCVVQNQGMGDTIERIRATTACIDECKKSAGL